MDGLLFRRESYTYGVGLAWGLVYGLMWWLLGPLTLMPILLGNPLREFRTPGTGMPFDGNKSLGLR